MKNENSFDHQNEAPYSLLSLLPMKSRANAAETKADKVGS
jgi:hypothetical protein